MKFGVWSTVEEVLLKGLKTTATHHGGWDPRVSWNPYEVSLKSDETHLRNQ